MVNPKLQWVTPPLERILTGLVAGQTFRRMLLLLNMWTVEWLYNITQLCFSFHRRSIMLNDSWKLSSAMLSSNLSSLAAWIYLILLLCIRVTSFVALLTQSWSFASKFASRDFLASSPLRTYWSALWPYHLYLLQRTSLSSRRVHSP